MLDGLRISELADLEVEDWLSDRVAGEGDTLADWVASFLDDIGFFRDKPKEMEQYFDFEAYGRDLLLGGDVSTANVNGRVLVFWNR
jgi:antirestriction protein